MTSFKLRMPNFESKVRASFANQQIMSTLGASLEHVAPGVAEISLPFDTALTQQHGYLHAGIITTIVDNACGYAALSLMKADATVLTIEYKVNFLSPAVGTHFLARGEVIRAGRTITVCRGEVFAMSKERGRKVVATMQATMIAVKNQVSKPA